MSFVSFIPSKRYDGHNTHGRGHDSVQSLFNADNNL